MLKQQSDFNEKLREDMGARLSIQSNETTESNMDVDDTNTMVTSLRTLKLSAVEKFSSLRTLKLSAVQKFIDN